MLSVPVFHTNLSLWEHSSVDIWIVRIWAVWWATTGTRVCSKTRQNSNYLRYLSSRLDFLCWRPNTFWNNILVHDAVKGFPKKFLQILCFELSSIDSIKYQKNESPKGISCFHSIINYTNKFKTVPVLLSFKWNNMMVCAWVAVCNIHDQVELYLSESGNSLWSLSLRNINTTRKVIYPFQSDVAFAPI